MAIDSEQWVRAARVLASWRRPLILSHVRPDGDAIGAIIGVSRICRGLGAEPLAAMYDDPPPRYRDLTAAEPVCRWPGPARTANADGIVILDTCSWQQLEPAAEFLRQSSLPRIVVDHHKTRDAIGGDGGAEAGVLYCTDDTASAACLLVHEWARAANMPVDAEAAAAIFVGIATDTGWFRFSNTDRRTLAAAADLVETGVRPDRWYSAIYESASLSRIHLQGAMLASVEVSESGRLSYASLTREMFAAAGASMAETEDLIQDLQRLAGVVASVLFVEDADGRVRVSLRSKAPHVCGIDVDVAAIAAALGGGGHARAAGARLAMPLDEAKRRVLAAVREAMNGRLA